MLTVLFSIYKQIGMIATWIYAYVRSFLWYPFYAYHKESMANNTYLKKIDNLDPMHPIVFVHGMLIFGSDNPLLYMYTGFYEDFMRSVMTKNNVKKFKMYSPTIACFSGWRCRCLETIIKTKIQFPEWSVLNPIHLIGHSLGSITVMKLIDILRDPGKYEIKSIYVQNILKKNRMALGSKYDRLNDLTKSDYVLFKSILDILFCKNNDFNSVHSNKNLSGRYSSDEEDDLSVKYSDRIHNRFYDRPCDKQYGEKMIKSVTAISGLFTDAKAFKNEVMIDPIQRKIIPKKFKLQYLLTVIIRLYIKFMPDIVKWVYDFGIEANEIELKSLFDCFTFNTPLFGDQYAFWDAYAMGNAELWKNTTISKNIAYLTIAYDSTSPYCFLPKHSSVVNLISSVENPVFIEPNDGMLDFSNQLNFINQKKIAFSDAYEFYKGRVYYAIEHGDHMDTMISRSLTHQNKMYVNFFKYLNMVSKQ
jgi:hypothetical protein